MLLKKESIKPNKKQTDIKKVKQLQQHQSTSLTYYCITKLFQSINSVIIDIYSLCFIYTSILYGITTSQIMVYRRIIAAVAEIKPAAIAFFANASTLGTVKLDCLVISVFLVP